MKISALPPVGQRVRWHTNSSSMLSSAETAGFTDQHITWLASGTAALALAIRQALVFGRQQEESTERKEVLLPGYGCPDLIAACIHAGAVPRLVDCARDEPGFDLEALRAACGPATAAIVAVNFLGIREPLAAIKAIAEPTNTLLIEDCAQWFPESPSQVPVAARIVSFGRGKPVNLLGGGALLLPSASPLPTPSAPRSSIAPLTQRKAWVFNQLLRPTAYGVVSRAPGLQLGATRYHSLGAIEALDPVRRGLMAANVDAWLRHRRWREDLLDSELAGADTVTALPISLAARRGRLLRYPVLCADPATRDRLAARLKPLGASSFYGRALAEVDGVPEAFTQAAIPAGINAEDQPQARDFAARLLTLPLHDGVDEYHLRRMAAMLRAL